MASQSSFSSLCFSKIKASKQRFFHNRIRLTSGVPSLRNQTFPSLSAGKSRPFCSLHTNSQGFLRVSTGLVNRGVKVSSSNPNFGNYHDGFVSEDLDGSEQLLKERKPKVSSPSKKHENGSLLGPLSVLMSFSVSPWLAGCALSAMTFDVVDSAPCASLALEGAAYAGLATFLIIMDRARSSYLPFSAKRLSLVRDLIDYWSLSFLMKIGLPLVCLYFTWPIFGKDALHAVIPLLSSCFAQYMFERSRKLRASAYWPFVPIIIEAHRVVKLVNATHSMEKLMVSFIASRGDVSLQFETCVAILGIACMFQVMGVICFRSLITYLLRLFPSGFDGEN